MLKHSVANYPDRFLGYMISPTKICIQFQDVISKLRFKEGASYQKMPDCIRALPIRTTGTDVDILAVGCQLPVLEDLQHKLIIAYKQYYKLHKDRYKEEYKKDFIEFLRELEVEIKDAIREAEELS